LRARQQVVGSVDDAREARDRATLRLSALGSGSDYTPFLQHLGIASLDIGFGGEDGGGSYHSIFDSVDHYTRFLDPSFEYGTALAKVGGRTVLRLANAEVLPFDPVPIAESTSRFAREVQKLADDLREQTEEQNRRVREGLYALADDPRLALAAPKSREPVPFVNFAPLQNAVARMQRSAAAFRKAAEAAPPDAAARDARNAALLALERKLTRAEGLPGRPWFTHQVYAPGFYTGYGVKTLPAIREALEQRQWAQAARQVDVVARTLDEFSAEVERLTPASARAPEAPGTP
jgi:N-acetylated-alpha-linked acidic dipeptidase